MNQEKKTGLFEKPQLLKFTHAQQPALSYCFTWIQEAASAAFEKSFPSFEAERCLVNNVQEIVAHRRWMIQASRLSVQTFHLYLAAADMVLMVSQKSCAGD